MSLNKINYAEINPNNVMISSKGKIKFNDGFLHNDSNLIKY